MHSWKKIVAESTPVLLVCSFFSVLAGVTLESNLAVLAAFPSLLLLLPAFIDSCGDLSEIFAAHLSSFLHCEKSERKERKEIILNVKATTILSFGLFFFLAVASYWLSQALGLSLPSFPNYIGAVMASAVVSIIAAMAVATAIAVVTFRHKLDPDDFESPMLSTLNDLAGT
ncbi:MAG: magnesium transporter, partial [Candidatus Micrarchaeota archaeon]